jgi:hypothetical protein
MKYSLIRFLNARDVKPTDSHCRICDVYGENAMSDGMVRKWIRKFNEGRDNVDDKPQSSWPSVVSDDLVCTVKAKVHEDRWFNILSLSLHFQQISRTVVYEIVTDCLDFWKFCSCCVLKILSEEHRKKWAASALTFLTRYSEQVDGFLSQIVTGDETRVSHLSPELKQQSLECRHTSSPKKHRFKQTISTRKIMGTVFWDRQGDFLVEFLPQGTIINSNSLL